MLAKQDVVEATSNVTKRLEFINAERLVVHFVDFFFLFVLFLIKPLFVLMNTRRTFTDCTFSLLYYCTQNAIEKTAEAIEKKFDQTQRDIQILQQRQLVVHGRRRRQSANVGHSATIRRVEACTLRYISIND